jgi:phage recombination protein Bet
MSNDLVKYKWQDTELTLTKSDVRNLISTDPNVTDKEIHLFMELCRYQSLNPFVREAYLIKYGSYPASMVVGKEVFTKRAEINPDFDGYELHDNYKSGMDLNDFEVACDVYRKNLKIPISVTVSYSEYVGTDSKGNVNRMWKSKPRTMLRKVALMQCLRETFPTALGGLYEETELDQKEVPKDITPKVTINKAKLEPEDFYPSTEEEETEEEVRAKVESVFPKQEEITDEDLPQEEESEPEVWQDPDFKPASEKQLNFIYGVGKKKGIVHSHLMTDKEIERIGKSKDMDIAKASKILAWWWGDKEKNIIGEQEKREKDEKLNPKKDKNELEKRGELMKEVLDLMEENHIKPAERDKMYKKYQKDEIIKLAYEELEELKAMLEEYTPDWK